MVKPKRSKETAPAGACCLRRTANGYTRDEGGVTALTFGLALSVMMFGIGTAIDYSGMVTERQRLQASLDTAVLAAVSGERQNRGQTRRMVRQVTRESFRPTLGTHDNKIKVKTTPRSEEVRATAEVAYDPVFMQVFGYSRLPIKVGSTAKYPAVPALNVALVVDVTDSMAGPNLNDLKVAATELVDQLEDSGADVHMSLVPYSEYVNVGLGNAAQDWVDASFTEYYRPSRTRSGVSQAEGGRAEVCTRTGPLEPVSRLQDGVVVAVDYVPSEVCTPPEPGHTSTSVDEVIPSRTWEYRFNGCMGSRREPANLRPDAGPGDRIPAGMDAVAIRIGDDGEWKDTRAGDWRRSRCGQSVTPLTEDFDVVRSSIDTLTTIGDTYLPAGLIWGWRTLDASQPYPQAASRPANARPVMIFMTDGENSTYKVQQFHRRAYSSSANANFDVETARARSGITTASEICRNAKDAGVEIYTLGYNLPAGNLSSETSGFLRSCASGASKAFSPGNLSELKNAFAEITDSLNVVRLSK